MQALVDRDFIVRNAADIIGLFGVGVYLNLILMRRTDLFEAVADWHLRHGIPMPGRVGNAYRLSALLEYRVARIYGRLAERFSLNAEARDLFRELEREEIQHGQVMMLCLYTVRQDSGLTFIPSVRDPEMREILQKLRRIERNVEGLSLEQALDLTLKLEEGEVNTIFGRLLKQVEDPKTRFFAHLLSLAGSHQATVPPRVARLRESLHSDAA